MDQIIETAKTIGAIITCLLLAIFARRYSELKKRDAILRSKETEDEKKKIIADNNGKSLDELVKLENDGFKSRRDH